MKTLNFSIDVIEPGKKILYLEKGGIKETTVDSFDISFRESATVDNPDPVIVVEYYLHKEKYFIESDKITYAEDFESLIDKLEAMYYKDKDKPVLPRGVEQVDMLASDEDIAKRTTYLCSDGKFYTISCEPVTCHSDPELSYRHFIVNNTPGIIIADSTLSECEQELFDIRGCEICRIVEDDKGKYTIQDWECESVGFIFMSLDAAKNAAYWLMEDYNAAAFVEGLETEPSDAVVDAAPEILQEWFICGETQDEYKAYFIDVGVGGLYRFIESCSEHTLAGMYTSKIKEFENRFTAISFLSNQHGGADYRLRKVKEKDGKTINYHLYPEDTKGRFPQNISRVAKGNSAAGTYKSWDEAVNAAKTWQKEDIKTDPSDGYREIWLCKNGDLYYMCSGSSGKAENTFANYQLWKYPKGSTSQYESSASEWESIHTRAWLELGAEYFLYYNNHGEINYRSPIWEIKDKQGKILATEKTLPSALDEAHKLKRIADQALAVKENTRITLPSDDAVYIINHEGKGLALIARITEHSEYGMYLYPDGVENFDTYWDSTVDELEKWLDVYHTINYIIRSTDSEKKEYKAFIGRTAETTGFVFTDKDAAVETTLRVNMGISNDNTPTEELMATIQQTKIPTDVIVDAVLDTDKPFKGLPEIFNKGTKFYVEGTEEHEKGFYKVFITEDGECWYVNDIENKMFNVTNYKDDISPMAYCNSIEDALDKLEYMRQSKILFYCCPGALSTGRYYVFLYHQNNSVRVNFINPVNGYNTINDAVYAALKYIADKNKSQQSEQGE